MLKYTQSAGGVVVNARGEILLVQQRGRSWSFPKGHVDVGESLLTCAKREILEESGVSHLILVRKLEPYSRHPLKNGTIDRRELKTITLFLFRTDQEELAPRDPHNPVARWVVPDEVNGLLTHEIDRDFFTRIRALTVPPPSS